MSQIAALRRKIDQLIIVTKQNQKPSPLEKLNPVQRKAIADWLAKIEDNAPKTPEGFYTQFLEQDWSPINQFLGKLDA